jgi:hypothetical protein
MKPVSGDCSMTADPFTDRLARVRDRFATTLAGKIDPTCAAIPAEADSVAEAYRCVHGIRPPQREGRGLTADEIAVLTKTLQPLREVAARELQSFHSVRS